MSSRVALSGGLAARLPGPSRSRGPSARLGLMRNFAGLLLAVCVCSSAQAQATSVADRVAKQNTLFEELYQAGLKSSPERATSVGDYRYNAQLSDASLEQIARLHAENDAFLARLRAIPTTG